MRKAKIKLLFFCICVNLLFLAQQSIVRDAESGETGTFTGSWTATGSKEILPFGEGRDTALFRIAGHVNLHDHIGNDYDYWSTCIGLADTVTGADVRCVWTSLHDDEIYLTLSGKLLTEGIPVTGKIIGGSNALQGITGSIQFQWSSMFSQSDNNTTNIGGYAKELSGSYQLP